MKLKDYMKQLNELASKDPRILDLEVYTSMDDEGNGFNKVHYSPSVAEGESVDVDEDFIVILN